MIKKPAVSKWVSVAEGSGALADCALYCANYYAFSAHAYPDFRAAMFENLQL